LQIAVSLTELRADRQAGTPRMAALAVYTRA
jgi:hypothetical protein